MGADGNLEFKASDDDLPSELFTQEVRNAREPDVRARAEVAAQVHFPAIRTPSESRDDQRRLARSISGEIRASATEGHRQYVKLGKKQQMAGWCLALEPLLHVLSAGEGDFIQCLLRKFRHYGVKRAKWITQKQYEWLLHIAATNIELPGVKRGKQVSR